MWPTVLGYVRREAMRIDVSERVIEESLSGLGIIDVNRKRIADRREPFTLATIMYKYLSMRNGILLPLTSSIGQAST